MRTSEKIRLITLVLLLVVAGASYFARGSPTSMAQTAAAEPVRLSERSKQADCQVNGPYPDPDCTPGAVFPVTAEQVCVSGYSSGVRNVSAALKAQVYAEYGLPYPQKTGSYEADHFIPLELGGSNDIANLFPEAAEPNPGFRQKDVVENYLHQEVCAGRMDLSSAQQAIADDWLKVYKGLSPWTVLDLQRKFAN